MPSPLIWSRFLHMALREVRRIETVRNIQIPLKEASKAVDLFRCRLDEATRHSTLNHKLAGTMYAVQTHNQGTCTFLDWRAFDACTAKVGVWYFTTDLEHYTTGDKEEPRENIYGDVDHCRPFLGWERVPFHRVGYVCCHVDRCHTTLELREKYMDEADDRQLVLS